jgi:UDP-N-acetylmuramoylalanine-D-glutamate ligase
MNSEFVLLLPNTDSFEQFADFVRGCSTTKYWQLSSVFSRSRTSSDKNLQIFESCQYLVGEEQALTKSSKCWKLSVFGRRTSSDNYQILTVFNNLKMNSEFVLLLPNTDSFEQFADFVRGCSTTKYIVEVEQALTKIFTSLKLRFQDFQRG